MALNLVIAVFAYFGADTFVKQPAIVVTSLGIIPLAMIVGLALYRFKWNPAAVTVIALVAVGIMIVAGHSLPIELGGNSLATWMIVLLAYCYFASIIPVNILLQPRDYLSSFLLVAGKPLGEPVAWRGPIVMNTQEELRTAFDEYSTGTFLRQVAS